jgi:hypothetical protein
VADLLKTRKLLVPLKKHSKTRTAALMENDAKKRKHNKDETNEQKEQSFQMSTSSLEQNVSKRTQQQPSIDVHAASTSAKEITSLPRPSAKDLARGKTSIVKLLGTGCPVQMFFNRSLA